MGLKKQLNENEIKEKRPIYQKDTEELKQIIGETFENEFNRHSTGDYIQNDVLGFERQGIIDWLIQTGMISKKIKRGLAGWFVVLPAYRIWSEKTQALKELWDRRANAKKYEAEAQNF